MAQKQTFKLLEPRSDLPQVEVPGLLEDGRVPLDLLNADLAVFVPGFPALKADDTLTLYINTISSGQTIKVTAEDLANPAFKAAFSISKANYPAPGSYFEVSLDYEYVDAQSGEVSRSSGPVKVIFDREAPGGASIRALTFALNEDVPITDKDLVNGELPSTAYAWYGMEVGDVIVPWVSDSAPVDSSIDKFLLENSAVVVERPGGSIELKFPRQSFEGVGERYFGYKLRDKLWGKLHNLDNESVLSPVTRFSVDLPVAHRH